MISHGAGAAAIFERINGEWGFRGGDYGWDLNWEIPGTQQALML